MSNNNTPFLDAPMNISGAPMPDMNPIQVSAFGNEPAARQTAASAGMYAALGEQATRMQDYKSRAAGMAQLDELQRQSEAEADRGLTAAPGHEDSFYYADGTLNQDKVDDFALRWTEQYEAVSPQFSSREGDFDWAQDRNKYLSNSVQRITGKAISHELSTIRRTSESRIQAAMANGDAGGLYREAQLQVKAGILTQQEADNLTRKAAKSVARSRGSARRSSGRQGARQNVNATFSSLYNGYQPEGEEKPISPPSGSDAVVAEMEESTPSLTEVEVGTDESSSLTLPTDPHLGQGDMGMKLQDIGEGGQDSLDLGDGYDEDAFASLGLSSMGSDELMNELDLDFQGVGNAEFTDMNDDGNTMLDISPIADEETEELQEQINAFGGLTQAKQGERAHQVAVFYASRDDWRGATDKEIRKKIMEDIHIKGIEDKLFGGDTLAYNSYVGGIIDNVLSVRGNTMSGEDNALIEIDRRIKEDYDDEQWLKNWKSPSYDKRLRTRRINSQKRLARQRAIDEIANLRRSNNSSWAKEQQVIARVIEDTMRDEGQTYGAIGEGYIYYDQSGDDAERLYLEARDKAIKDRARWYHYDASKALKDVSRRRGLVAQRDAQIEEEQRRAKEQEKEEKKRAAAQLKEEQNEAKRRAELEERERNPYRYRVPQKVSWDTNQGDDSAEPVITVPMSQYADICEQLGIEADEDAGVVATVGRGRKHFVVKAGDVDGVRGSSGFMSYLFKSSKRKMSKKEMQRRLHGSNIELQYHKY